ncbi:MAG: FAD-binding oxidoreductase [Thermodesulfobacteriota bacterium]|jgi:glycolate oxidase FAD binding subunit
MDEPLTTETAGAGQAGVADLGKDCLGSAEDRRRFSIDGREPQHVVFPETIEQVSAVLQEAHRQGLAVAPVGCGAFLHLGGIPRRYQLALSLSRLARLVDYQPTDMTVTVEAGMTLGQLQQILEAHGQWLPLDPPLPDRATVGGVIAANLSGPARLSQGTIRDFLLGLRVVQADGTVVKGGGRVVKNVAGYDLPKLYCGSFGTLGVIVEATCKVRPRPAAHAVLSLALPSPGEAMGLVQRILGSELQPFFLVLTNFDPTEEGQEGTGAYRLLIGFAGIPEEVAYQRHRLQELARPQASGPREWEGEDVRTLAGALRDFPAAGDASLRCKLGILPAQLAGLCQELEEEASLRALPVQLLVHAGNGIVYVRVPASGDVPAEKVLSAVDWLRIAAKQRGGYMTVEAISPRLKERVDVWGHPGNAFSLMKQLKETLDPHGILNPGRFVGGI